MKKRTKITIAATLLLALGVYILRFSPISYTILRHSTMHGYYWIAAAQLALGVNPDGPALAWALHLHHAEIAKMLLHHGANPKYKPLSGPNYALHTAVEMGDAELVRMLLDKGCDPNAMPMGVTPLHVAAGYGDLDIAQMLVQAGAWKDVKALGWSQPWGCPYEPPVRHRPNIAKGATPLDVAVGTKNKPLVRVLSLP